MQKYFDSEDGRLAQIEHKESNLGNSIIVKNILLN